MRKRSVPSALVGLLLTSLLGGSPGGAVRAQQVSLEPSVPGEAPIPFEIRGPSGQRVGPPELVQSPQGMLQLDWDLEDEEDAAPSAPLRETRRRGFFDRLFRRKKKAEADRPALHTRYPVVLIHGANNPQEIRIGKKRIRYFGRAVPHLRRLGLRLLVPRVNPFGSIEERAAQVERQILRRLPEGKFNLVGHSMGGLDARYIASKSALADRVASVTTIATPHHGAWYADFAHEWIFRRQGLDRLGGLFGMRFDQIPALRVRYLEGTFNRLIRDNPEVAYYSYGTAAPVWKSPLFFWGMNAITRLMEKRALRRIGPGSPLPVPVGIRSREGEIRLPGDSADTISVAGAGPSRWVIPKWVGRNDGVVSLSSSVWGTYLGTIRTHHWGPMGLMTGFREHHFWEEVMRKLAEQGF